MSTERVKRKKSIVLLKWLLLGLVALGINFFGVGNYVVKGPSMIPTFHHGDRIIINKFPPLWGELHKGTLIVFRDPEQPEFTSLKRIVGGPGDVIEVFDDQLHVNGYPIPGAEVKGMDQWEPALIPPNAYFVLGDNHMASHDSRRWSQRFIFQDAIVGTVAWQYWSVETKVRVEEQSAVTNFLE